MADDGGGNGGRVQVGVVVGGDLDPMVEFYVGILGFKHFRDVPVPGGVVRQYVLGESGVKLVTFDEPPTLANPPGGPAPGGASGLRYLTVEVDDVAATVDRIGALGCAVPLPTFEHEGKPVAIVADPEGNWVELIEPARAR